MRTSSLPAGLRQSHTSRTSIFRPVFGLSLAMLMLGVSVLPAQAWWFSSVGGQTQQTAIASTNNAGLFLSPISSWVPQFILQPLTPSTTPTPTPTVQAVKPVVKPTAKPSVAPQTTPAIASNNNQPATRPEVQQILDLVNKERTSRGLNALTLNAQLTQSAQKYAEQMQQYKFFDHVSAVDKSTFKDRNEAAGYTNWSWMGENIAYGQTTAAEVMNDWMNSEGHRANILNVKAKELGVGFAPGSTPYWVQEFGATF